MTASYGTTRQNNKELFPETKRDWKISKLEDMSGHVQQLQDELVAVDVQLEELKLPVIESPQLGQYKSIVCGKCHIRDHRAEGNRHNAACMREVCTSLSTNKEPNQKTKAIKFGNRDIEYQQK